MLIHDGYNRHITLRQGQSATHVVYRPALFTERQRFQWHASFMNAKSSVAEITRWMAQHLVMWDAREEMTEAGLKSLRGRVPEMYEQLWMAINGRVADDSGEVWETVEAEYESNLRAGVLLLLSNPRLANRDCNECQTFWFSEKTGLPILNNSDGTKMLRDGPTPCRSEVGCLKGTPEKSNALNKANGWAWRHWKSCDAVGGFPADPLVAHNASIIREAIKQHAARIKT